MDIRAVNECITAPTFVYEDIHVNNVLNQTLPGDHMITIAIEHGFHHHPLKCVQYVVLLGGALGRMFGGSPQFLFVFYRPDRRENVLS